MKSHVKAVVIGGGVVGCGPIGLFAIQWMRLMGASQVIAVDVSEEKLALAREAGATVTILSQDLAGNKLRADVVVEAVGIDGLFLIGEITARSLIRTATEHGTSIRIKSLRNRSTRRSVPNGWHWRKNALPCRANEQNWPADRPIKTPAVRRGPRTPPTNDFRPFARPCVSCTKQKRPMSRRFGGRPWGPA